MTEQELGLYKVVFRLSDYGKTLANEYLLAFREYQAGIVPPQPAFPATGGRIQGTSLLRGEPSPFAGEMREEA